MIFCPNDPYESLHVCCYEKLWLGDYSKVSVMDELSSWGDQKVGRVQLWHSNGVLIQVKLKAIKGKFLLEIHRNIFEVSTSDQPELL